MTKDLIYRFIKEHPLAVIATISTQNLPQSALIGIAVTEELDIIFDAVNTSRKYANLIHHPHIAMVIGWDNEITVQYEGTATLLSGTGGARYKEAYFAALPDARHRAETWQGIVHFKVTPTWIRYSNFNEPQAVEEIYC